MPSRIAILFERIRRGSRQLNRRRRSILTLDGLPFAGAVGPCVAGVTLAAGGGALRRELGHCLLLWLLHWLAARRRLVPLRRWLLVLRLELRLRIAGSGLVVLGNGVGHSSPLGLSLLPPSPGSLASTCEAARSWHGADPRLGTDCGRQSWSQVLVDGWSDGAHRALSDCPRAATWDGHVRASFVPQDEKNTDLTICHKTSDLAHPGLDLVVGRTVFRLPINQSEISKKCLLALRSGLCDFCVPLLDL